jgi:hypothetical protein
MRVRGGSKFVIVNRVSDLIRVFDRVDVMAKMSSRFGLTPGDRAGLKVDARRRRT